MAFDSTLAKRIRTILAHRKGFTEKKMFGGLAFILEDKMCCGIQDDQLMARIGPEQYESALRLPYVKPMDFTGRPLKGYVYVESSGLRTKAQLKKWVDLSVSFTSSLQNKSRNKKRLVKKKSAGRG